MRTATEAFIFTDGTAVVDIPSLLAKLDLLSEHEIAQMQKHIAQWTQTALDEPHLAQIIAVFPASKIRPFLHELVTLSVMTPREKMVVQSQFGHSERAMQHNTLKSHTAQQSHHADYDQIHAILGAIASLGFTLEQAVIIFASSLDGTPLYIESQYKVPKLESIYAAFRHSTSLSITLQRKKLDVLMNTKHGQEFSKGYTFSYAPIVNPKQNLDILTKLPDLKKEIMHFLISPKILDLLNEKIPKQWYKSYDSAEIMSMIQPLVALHALSHRRNYALPTDCQFALKHIFIQV
jgi:hypothetical protein